MLSCKNCVMDQSDPSLTLNNDGVCHHCSDFYKDSAETWRQSSNGELEEVFKNQCIRIKSESVGKDFDCLVGLSGGLDSSYMLHSLVTKYGLKPLVFHVDAGWNTKDATQNIHNITTKLGLELFVEVVDWENIREVQKAFYRAGVSHLDTPQDVAFFAATYNFAIKHDIKYIMNGGNISTEAVMVPLEWMYYANDTMHFNDIVDQFSNKVEMNFPTFSILKSKVYLPYFKKIKVIRPLNLIRYVKEEAEKTLSEEYGFLPFKNKHYESVFTRFNEGYWLPRKFNYDTRKVTFSSLILTGQMTRDQALRKLSKSDLTEEEWVHEKNFIVKKLKISSEEFEGYFNLKNRSFRDYKNLSLLYSFGARFLNLIGGEFSIKK